MTFLNEHLTRQADLIPTEILGEQITIIGAGAIGSFTALALAKMGFANIRVMDFDKVDTVNMNSQFYRFGDIGKDKVKALYALVKDFTNVEINDMCARYTGDIIFQGIVISAVDSMEVRKQIWQSHAGRAQTKAIIDPRMGAETALLFVMNPMDANDRKTYEDSLYSDDTAVQERCTAKATIYTATMLSGLVAKSVKDFLTQAEYLRVAQWDIRANAFQAWRKK